ncbi:MAG: cytochrome c556 [Enterobacterales bacterium]|jgi:cytochrome c556
MKQHSKTALTLSTLMFSLILISNTSAVEATAKSISLKGIMQSLLSDTQKITEGIFLDNFQMIEKAANNIATHPEIPKPIKMKLMKSFGPKMVDFKAYDTLVHNAAVEINKAAKEKDRETILKQYQQMISDCQSCHNKFKVTVQQILK